MLFNIKTIGRLLSALTLSVVLLIAYIPAQIARASISSCSATVFQHTVDQGSNTNFEFEVTNTSSSSIQWIKVTRPSVNFTNINGNISYAPWAGSSDSESSTFSGGNIDPGSSLDHIFENADAATPAAAANWTVEVSDDSSGANPFSCGGSLGTSISAPAPIVSNIAVSNISSSGVIISWDTDVESTSQVNYGSDDSYGNSSPLDSNLVASHSITLKSLNSNTGYHFQVTSVGAGGSSANSGDSTFLTALEGATSIVTKTIMLPGLAVQVTNPGDKTPPIIAITTVLPKVVQAIPKISGTAGDDIAVMRIEYSTDGGKNWLPVDSAPKLNDKKTDFSFTPANLGDGNYTILARAIDPGGNITVTTPINLVVDRLPPLVGGNLITIGPQTLKPDSSGLITTLVGVDQKITMSAVGGPTSITIEATSSDNKNKIKSFSLTQSADTGLWSGILSFEVPGTYSLLAKSVDGAGNKVSRILNTVNVAGPASVIRAGTDKPVVSKTTVYYWEAESSQWMVWDGAAYGQDNPVSTDKKGQFSLVLPAGKYYLKTSAKGYKTLTSDIFKLNDSTPISTTLDLKSLRGLRLGPVSLHWPDLSVSKINLSLKSPGATKQNSQIGQPLPVFSLSDTSGKQVSSLDFLGKPTVLSVMATWAPQTSEQLRALSDIQTNTDINVEVVAAQEDAARVRVYTDISGYKLMWLVDPDSGLTKSLNFTSLPTHYFIDRKGVIKKVVTGVLSKDQIINTLAGI